MVLLSPVPSLPLPVNFPFLIGVPWLNPDLVGGVGCRVDTDIYTPSGFGSQGNF